jgi:Fe-S cluster assembly iron-binding protein IscA
MIEQSQESAIETSAITMTRAAAEKVCELLTQELEEFEERKKRGEVPAGEEAPNLGLRIFVAGGGCSGLQYGMTLDERQDDDTVDVFDWTGKCMELDEEQKHAAIDPRKGFKTLVDYVSLGHVKDSTVGYVASLMGAGFTVDNPNAVSSCGCGHSFKTADTDAGEARGCGCSH